MIALGYIAAVFIGIALGLIGGGGSILTVPVLVYLLGVEPVMATAYSLFIVGITSLIGSFSFFKNQLVNIKTAFVFGVPSIVAVYLTRAYLVPAIPTVVIESEVIIVTKNMLLMLLFAALMVVASYSMIKGRKKPENEHQVQEFNYFLILIEGVVVGTLTGLVGAGGGFLIIPALVLLSKLPMKMAVGTSLVIIAVKSLIGFLGEDLALIEWEIVLPLILLAVLGIVIGSYFSQKIKGEKLKPAFGWFVLVMGIYILLKELFLG